MRPGLGYSARRTRQSNEMPWIRIDDHFNEHPKLAGVGPLGWAMWLAGLAYCNRNLTNGFIPWAVAKTLVSWEFLEPKSNGGSNAVTNVAVTSGMSGDDVTAQYVIDRLVWWGVWENGEEGYWVHDYLDYQPSRDQVQKERKQTAERQKRHRKSNGDSNGVTNGDVTPAPNPNPNPLLKEKNRPRDKEEVVAYFTHLKVKDPLLEAEKFLAHFEMVGWVYGKSKHPIKDWKAACVTWKKNMKADDAEKNYDRV